MASQPCCIVPSVSACHGLLFVLLTAFPFSFFKVNFCLFCDWDEIHTWKMRKKRIRQGTLLVAPFVSTSESLSRLHNPAAADCGVAVLPPPAASPRRRHRTPAALPRRRSVSVVSPAPAAASYRHRSSAGRRLSSPHCAFCECLSLLDFDEIHKWKMPEERIQQGTPLEAPLASTSEYTTRTWIGRSSSTLGRVVDLVEQLHISSGTPSPDFTPGSVHLATTEILAALREHIRTLRHQFSQPASPAKPLVPPPPEEDEQDGCQARRRRRTRLAATRTRLSDDELSSSSSQTSQSSSPTPSLPQPHPPQQQFPQHPYQHPGYIVYVIQPLYTGAAGSSTVPSSPFPIPYPYPYPYSLQPPPPPS
ncbi:hypothetical protein PIB30_043116 [Stylosanthes scabra]|uniref:Uncharacterized protein n=1 Tax=Stylosanthes scabra TaxID=79078 RepID=A0ABU6VIB0_9FABA|nr:hypothetical protein [Stylosanthes scabra]